MPAVNRRRHTDYTIIDGDNSFPVSFDPVFENEIVVKVTAKGDRAIVGYLSPDEDGGISDYFKDRDEGKFISFERDSIYSNRDMTREDIEELAQENPGRVFWVNKYEHGRVKYYRSEMIGAVPSTESAAGHLIPDQQWDVSRGCAIYVAPEDATDPAEYADGVLEEFTDWCNGSCYGVVVSTQELNEDGEWAEVESDECWGYIGYTHALEELAEVVESEYGKVNKD